MERKVQKNTRRQRRSRSWLFSPVIIAQLAVVMVLAGVGVSFALTDTPVNTQLQAPWAGYATISDGVLNVSSYQFSFAGNLTTVNGVTLNVTNIGGTSHTGTARVAFGSTTYGPTTIGSLGPGSSTNVSVTLPDLTLGAVSGQMRILVTTNN